MLTTSACRELDGGQCKWIGVGVDFFPLGIERKQQLWVKELCGLEEPMLLPWIVLILFAVLPATWRVGVSESSSIFLGCLSCSKRCHLIFDTLQVAYVQTAVPAKLLLKRRHLVMPLCWPVWPRIPLPALASGGTLGTEQGKEKAVLS